MKFLRGILSSSLALSLLSGCASEGGSKVGTGTAVNLSGNNYRVLRSGVSGTSSGFDLLGFIPLIPPSYAGAKRSLLHSSGISMTGRAVALANQTEDRSSLYLIAFSVPRITLTADVVEFTGATQTGVTGGPVQN